MDWDRINAEVIEEFRANEGRVARFGDLPVVILHTIGVRSGEVRLVPLIVVRDGEAMLLFGTKAGSPDPPRWAANLRATPRITVELGNERFTADVVELPAEEARDHVATQAAGSKPFAKYVEDAAPREVPVFEIRRV